MIQIADRRLTSVIKGRTTVAAENACKALLLKLPDSDYLVGYTGLALVEGKPMIHHLAECFTRAWAKCGENFDAFWVWAKIEVRDLFTSPSFMAYRGQDRRFTVMASGFVYDPQRLFASPRYLLMSNFQEWGVADHPVASSRFNFLPFQPKKDVQEPLTFIQAVGAYGVVRSEDIEALRVLLEECTNPRHVKNRIRGLFSRYTQMSSTIGPALNMSILYPGGDFDVDSFDGATTGDFGTHVLDLSGKQPTYLEAVPIAKR
ncbi:hypothetical protein [Microbacterium sp. nov. GSS16]|uniref:hypothetical protein n=1 Tax=Microbacterium sp. nov. GSS16 TaxID=3019890 RepID=UPI0023058B47|nr:hypothetical protein [Microbacterium sp. nov. GSS16]WCD91497.1 hypothetical protein PGB26_07225 [Microbacterium sp. nov. GSS16]